MSTMRIPLMALEPGLWGTLPKELLHLIFAHLSIAGIGQLRELSKEWKWNIDCKDSEFNQVFDATIHLNIFVTQWIETPLARNIFDVQINKRHDFETSTRVLSKGARIWATAHGGLMCYVSERSWEYNNLLLFTVINPLTNQKMQLPPLAGMQVSTIRPKIVKLVVDKETKEYKVFVVGSIKNNGGGFFAQIYDSHIKEWTIMEAAQGHIIGCDIFDNCNPHFAFDGTFCVYNCANGVLQHFKKTDFVPGFEVERSHCVLVEDHVFVLHKEASPNPTNLLEEDGKNILPKYCISEFHLSEKSTTWVKLRVHSGPFNSFNTFYTFKLTLLGCDGFLFVYSFRSNHTWLYNLSTCEWHTLPTFGERCHPQVMFKISWTAMA